MLVCLGSAVFTVLSIYGFPQVAGTAAPDPSRISAQIVTGIGFLGAGAIIKYGTNIRGLTTAASLWVVASIGLAAGAGAYFLAVAGTLIALLALWPLQVLVGKLNLTGGQLMRLELGLKKLDAFAGVSRVLLSHHVEIVSGRDREVAKPATRWSWRCGSRTAAHGRTACLADLEVVARREVRHASAAEEA